MKTSVKYMYFGLAVGP